MLIERTTDFETLAKALGCAPAHVNRPEFTWYQVRRASGEQCGFFLIIDMVENVELHLKLRNLTDGKETLEAVKKMLSIAAKEFRCPVRARIPRVPKEHKAGRSVHWGAVAAGFKRLAMSPNLIAYEWRPSWTRPT